MRINFINAKTDNAWPRIYAMLGKLRNFRGHPNVFIHIFRSAWLSEELEAAAKLNLTGPPDNALPSFLINDASRKAAIKCLLETFTLKEAEQLSAWLERNYADQFASLDIYPLQLPVPLGVSPIGSIPASANSGFINFDRARDYDLPFKARAYYDLNDAE